MTNVPHGGLAITCIFPLGSSSQTDRERERERERVSRVIAENKISQTENGLVIYAYILGKSPKARLNHKPFTENMNYSCIKLANW